MKNAFSSLHSPPCSLSRLCTFPVVLLVCSFLLSHALKDCEESVPTEEPRKLKDSTLSLCLWTCLHSFSAGAPSVPLYFLIRYRIPDRRRPSPCGTVEIPFLWIDPSPLAIHTIITAPDNYPACSWDTHFVLLIWCLK